MEVEGSDETAEAVIEALKVRGWCLGDINQLKALIIIQSALSDDDETSTVSDAVESEVLNMDLKSIGAKSLPEPNFLLKTSHIQGPKVLQISSVRDISVSSIEGFSDSSKRRLLRLVLTDGYNEITAIECSHIPSITNEVVPGTKVRLENRVPLQSGILCLNPKVITVMGGVVQSLYEEWQMNQKYSGLTRSSLMLSRQTDSGGPPPFEKLQIGAPFRRSSQQGRSSDYLDSTFRSSTSTAVETAGNTELRPLDIQHKAHKTDDKLRIAPLKENFDKEPIFEYAPVQNQATAQKVQWARGQPNQGGQYYRAVKESGCFESTSSSNVPTAAETAENTATTINTHQKADNIDDMVKGRSLVENIEQNPSNSEMRPKEVFESAPVQNQAAAQKLLQKMSHPNQGDQRSRGRKHRGKGRQEEPQALTLDEWENRKPGANPPMKNKLPDTSNDEDLARQLPTQLEVEDSNVPRAMHYTVADDIRMNMFNYDRYADRNSGVQNGGRGSGRGKGKGGSRGRGRGGKGRGRFN